MLTKGNKLEKKKAKQLQGWGDKSAGETLAKQA